MNYCKKKNELTNYVITDEKELHFYYVMCCIFAVVIFKYLTANYF